MKTVSLIEQYINVVSMQSHSLTKCDALERLRVRLLKELSHDELASAISQLIEQKILGVK